MIKLIMDAILISIFWFIALYTLKLDRIHLLISNRSLLIFNKKFIFISKTIVLVQILLEILLIAGNDVGVFLLLKDFLSYPFISHSLYLINLYVLFIAARHISSKLYDSEKIIIKAEKKANSFINGLIIISISIIIFYIQSVYWGELKYIYTKQGQINLPLEIIIDGILILVPGIIIMINSIRYLKQIKLDKLAVRISLPIIIFLGLTQPIITKLIVFYDFYLISYKSFVKQFGIKIKNDFNDKLLIASSLTHGNVNSKINAYFLLSYFSIVFILWTSQVSPLPIPSTVYANGLKISFCFSLSMLSFWIYEGCARSMPKLSNVFRKLFIPTSLVLTFIPFFTKWANMNYSVRMTEVFSIYHKLSLALGSNKVIFFMCLIFLQFSLAYILHLVTGEADDNKHYLSILPIIFIVQLLILSISYPIFLLIPPYFFYEKQLYFIIFISIFAVGITFLMGTIAFYLFDSSKSKWSTYINDYWKSKTRVFIITGIATAFTIIPISYFVIDPLHNINNEIAWEKSYVNSNESYTVDAFFQSSDLNKGYILLNDNKITSKIVVISTLDGEVLWDRTFDDYYTNYKVWENDTVVLTKDNNKGFTVLDLKTGYMHYNYDLNDDDKLEHVNIDMNDRVLLFTTDKKQFVYDMEYRRLELDTLGNNYYQLLSGNQCALLKDDDVYLYQYERWEKLNGIYKFDSPELLYYDNNGLIVFNKDNIVRYNYYLTKEDTIKYNKAFEHIMKNDDSYYTRVNNEATFYLYNKEKVFAYVFDTPNFTYRRIPLEQRVKDYNDYQKIKICDDEGSYFLYDSYQFTLYRNENIYARRWYQTDATIIGSPIKSYDKILWAEKDGKVYCVNTVIQ